MTTGGNGCISTRIYAVREKISTHLGQAGGAPEDMNLRRTGLLSPRQNLQQVGLRQKFQGLRQTVDEVMMVGLVRPSNRGSPPGLQIPTAMRMKSGTRGLKIYE